MEPVASDNSGELPFAFIITAFENSFELFRRIFCQAPVLGDAGTSVQALRFVKLAETDSTESLVACSVRLAPEVNPRSKHIFSFKLRLKRP